MSMVERAREELDQLNYWFKTNKGQQGTAEWNENIERGSELVETINNL